MLCNGSKREITSNHILACEEELISNSSNKKKNKIESGSDVVEVLLGKPQFIFGKQCGISDNPLEGSNHFSIHPSKHLIAFSNSELDRVVVYTLDGDHLTTLSHPDIINPIGVALSNDLIYVTCEYFYSCYLIRFSESNVKKVKLNVAFSQMWTPKGLECDHDGNVYFIDEFAHSVIIWSSDLVNYREIDLKGVCDEPVDLFIRLNQLFILSFLPPNILYISLTDDVFHGYNLNEYLQNPSSFCSWGKAGFIVADSNKSILKVFGVEKRLSLIKLEITIPSFACLNRIAMASESNLILLLEDSFYSVNILSN